MLMISAMFMIVSCGGNSNSNEAEESDVTVAFTDPAIVYDEGIDLTSCFSAESCTPPALYKDVNGNYRMSSNIKLKLVKKLDFIEPDGGYANVEFGVKFCDKGGSLIDSGHETKYEDRAHLKNLKEGTVISLDIIGSHDEILESLMEDLIKRVEKIEVSISTEKFVLKEEE